MYSAVFQQIVTAEKPDKEGESAPGGAYGGETERDLGWIFESDDKGAANVKRVAHEY